MKKKDDEKIHLQMKPKGGILRQLFGDLLDSNISIKSNGNEFIRNKKELKISSDNLDTSIHISRNMIE